MDGLNKIHNNQAIRYQPIITAKIPHSYYTIFCHTKEAQIPIVERFFKEKHPQFLKRKSGDVSVSKHKLIISIITIDVNC